MVSRVIPAVVLVQTPNGRGSGFFVGPDTIVTNVHVVGLKDWERLPFPRYFANVLACGADLAVTSAAEVARLLRPCGGILLSSKPEIGKAVAAQTAVRPLAGGIVESTLASLTD